MTDSQNLHSTKMSFYEIMESYWWQSDGIVRGKGYSSTHTSSASTARSKINTRLKVGSQILVLRKRFLTYSGSVFQQNRIVLAPDSPRVPNKLHGSWMHIWIVKYILYSNIWYSRFKVRSGCIFLPTTSYSSGSSHQTIICKHNNLNRLRLMGHGFGEYIKEKIYITFWRTLNLMYGKVSRFGLQLNTISKL